MKREIKNYSHNLLENINKVTIIKFVMLQKNLKCKYSDISKKHDIILHTHEVVEI